MSTPADGVDVAIVGAGVVGAAVFAELTARGLSTVLLESRERTGGETTERNSGVIHAGLWYPASSLKTRLCVEGSALLYAWAEARGVPHARPGKLVVAVDEEEEAILDALMAHARAVGARGLQRLDGRGLRARAPSVVGRSAVWSPETGIVDPVDLCASLVAAGRAAGGWVVTGARVLGLTAASPGWGVETARGPVRAGAVVNAAGLYADAVAALAGVTHHQIFPCRGDYYRWQAPAAPSCLVYPVKKPGDAGLGVHLTLDLAGRCRLGPDAYYVTRKDEYAGGGGRAGEFAAAASRILGPVRAEELAYESCGIRPKLRAPGEPAERDFVIAREAPDLVNLVGIESPGLTSALAIAREVAHLLGR